MKDEMKYEMIEMKDIQLIQPLWDKLRIIHRDESPFFRDYYDKQTFEIRTRNYLRLKPEDIRIEIVRIETGAIIGYCVSSIKEDHTGEIDSIYIEKDYRKNGIGEKFMKNSLEWFKRRKCKKVQLAVSFGHESVFAFYRKFGFYPRITYLEQI
jgi:diamine N-acetyltransferase